MHIPNFSFYRTPAILFGADAINKLGEKVLSFGKRALLVTGSKSLKQSDVAERIQNDFAEKGISLVYIEIDSEPSTVTIDKAAEQFRKERIDVVISIGGGSVLDAGKAISAMIPVRESVCAFIEGAGEKKHPGVKIPFIAVPTTSGTGSEASSNAVLTIDKSQGFKRSIRHPNFVPDIALVDPTLTVSCPPHITASCGMDCLTQLIESYVSNRSTPVTDSLVEYVLPGFTRSLIAAVSNGGDIGSRTHLSYAALISGITLANAGLGAVHGIAPVAGAWHKIPHGTVCGMLLAPITEKNIEKIRSTNLNDPALHKYCHIGELITGKIAPKTLAGCDLLIETLYDLKNRFFPTPLSEWGVEQEDIVRIAAASGSRNNPCELSAGDIEEAFKKV